MRTGVGWRRNYTRRAIPTHSTPPRLTFRCAQYEPTLPLQGRVRKNTLPHSRNIVCPSFANSFAPKVRGRREDRVRAAPAVSCAKVDKKAHMSIQVQRKHSGLPCAMVLRLIFVLSPVRPELVCHRRQRDAKHHRQLDTCHWGVRTTRLCRPLQPRSSVAALASTAPRPNVSDDGQRPLSRDGMAGISR
jgi:hypothetical protein